MVRSPTAVRAGGLDSPEIPVARGRAAGQAASSLLPALPPGSHHNRALTKPGPTAPCHPRTQLQPDLLLLGAHPTHIQQHTMTEQAAQQLSAPAPSHNLTDAGRLRSCHARCQQERQEPTPPTGTLTCVPRGSRGQEAGGREDNHLSLSIPQGAE